LASCPTCWATPTSRATIALLPGDGIGAEILDGPVAFLRQLERDGAPVRVTGPWPYGTTGWARTGSILPAETIDACRDADVILSGAVGTHPGITAEQCPNPEAALIRLRHLFDLRVSVRTVLVPGDEDVIIVRNITGGAYAGPERHVESDGTRSAEDLLVLEPSTISTRASPTTSRSASGPGRTTRRSPSTPG
jgi:3-isopropylmalate dehydrogenase